MTFLKVRPGVMKINHYIAGGSKIEGVDRLIKMASNENALGSSASAITAYHQAVENIHLYPDGDCTDLRHAIGARYDVNPEQVFCTAGSEQMLLMLPRAYAGPGDEILFGQYGFIVYRMATLGVGATPVTVEEPDCRIDVDLLLKAVTPRTRIVFIANPGNPTGTYLTTQEMQALRAGLPEDVLLVIDAAYADYIERDDYDSGLAMADEGPANVVVTRTLSKLHGLASLRVGWTYAAPEILDVVTRLRGGFNVAGPAQAAGIAALQDVDHMEVSQSFNGYWLSWLSHEMLSLGLTVTPSVTNFLLVHFPGGALTATAVSEHLRTCGIIVRPVGNYGLPDSLRVTIGKEDENKAFLAALKEIIGRAQ